MGIFFTSRRPAVPEVNEAIRVALLVDPALVTNPEKEASHRTLELVRATSARFNPGRFCVAVLIAAALLVGAIWTAKNGLPDISKDLMNSFGAFSGIVLGLLGGEAQKFS
jgi:hypothetical protein